MIGRTLLIFIFAISLSGCAVYKEDFDCPVGTGLPCTSLSKVNDKMNKGAFKEKGEERISQSDTYFGEEFLNEAGGGAYAG